MCVLTFLLRQHTKLTTPYSSAQESVHKSEPTVLLSNEKPVEVTVDFGILATSYC